MELIMSQPTFDARSRQNSLIPFLQIYSILQLFMSRRAMKTGNISIRMSWARCTFVGLQAPSAAIQLFSLVPYRFMALPSNLSTRMLSLLQQVRMADQN